MQLLSSAAFSQNTPSYYPTGHNLLGATSHVSGSLTDIQSEDGAYMSFRSSPSSRHTSEFPDYNTSNVDSISGNGTHSDFQAQQGLPDTIFDILREEDTGRTGGNWLPRWDKRVRVTVNGNDVDVPLADFPLLLHLSNSSSGENDEDLSFVFDEVGANRRKIAVTAGDGTTQCYVEVEEWNLNREEAWLWVRAPTLNYGNNTILYLYYDNDHHDNTAYVGDAGSAPAVSVWDSNYASVWHLKEDPSLGLEPRMKDSTFNPANMVTYGTMTGSDLVDGQIDGGTSFDGVDDYFQGDAAKLDLNGVEVTLEAWVRVPAGGVDNDEAIIVKGNSTNLERYMLGVETSGGGSDLLNGRITNSGGTHYRFDVPGVPRGVWTYVAVRYDGSRLKGYVDGALLPGADIAATGSIGTAVQDVLRSGRRLDNRWYEGEADELRISDSARSEAWIRASYESGRDHLLDYGVEESTNYKMDLEVQWADIDYKEMHEDLAVYIEKGDNTHSFEAMGGYVRVGDGTPDWGSSAGTISWWIQWNTLGNRPWGQHGDMEARFSGANLVLDWGTTSGLTSNTSFVPGEWYFIAIVWNEAADELGLYVGDQHNPPTLDAYNNAWTSTVSTLGVIENNFMASRSGVDPTDGRGDDLRYWNIDRNQTEIQADYNIELDGSESGLRSYYRFNNNFNDTGPNDDAAVAFGAQSFSITVPFDPQSTESIRVDVWHGSSWQSLFIDLNEGWNNISVSPYLDSSTFTIRFKGDAEISDDVQDSWRVDSTLLHLWSTTHIAEVEFTGASDVEEWTQLTWTVATAWTTSSVNVTMQLYDYTLDEYALNGSGNLSYTSSILPDDISREDQDVTVDPARFRDTGGFWKLKVTGVKETDSSFDLKVDMVKFEITHVPLHSIAILSVTPALTQAYTGQIINVTIVVENQGTVDESFNITLFYNDTVIRRESVSNLPPEAEAVVTFSWNTSTVSPATYIIKAVADPAIDEIDVADNTFTGPTVRVRPQTQSFDWLTPFLLGLLGVFGVLLIPVFKLKRKKEQPRSFSEHFGMTHEEKSGKKMLLEIDPASDYHKILFSFVSEARKSGEPVFINTRRNSPLHLAFSKAKDVNFLLMTSNITGNHGKRKKEIPVPVCNFSVLLNATTEALKKKSKKNVNILFDDISGAIIRCGYKETYNFLNFVLETISSHKATSLFVFNSSAHDSDISSSIRGLFKTQFTYTRKGSAVQNL